MHLILQTYFSSELRDLQPDAFFVDQLSAGLPLLQYLQPKAPILFYCHFPDLLLAQGRKKWWKRMYRVPFDVWEQWSMSFANAIAVNSRFTKGIVAQTWPALARTKDLKVVYPCMDTRQGKDGQMNHDGPMWKGKRVILSINRFERKKDIALAIKAFAQLPVGSREEVRLVIAGKMLYPCPAYNVAPRMLTLLSGGYDNRVSENVGYHKELVALAESLGLRNATTKTIVTALSVANDVDVLFLLSVPNTLKEMLLRCASLLVYTPSNEHFGIVPLEAMLAGVPVLAANTGGPTETVVEGVTGWLREPAETRQWTDVMDRVLNKLSRDELAAMTRAGIERVKNNFADVQMAQRLDVLFEEIEGSRPQTGGGISLVLVGLLALVGMCASVAFLKLAR